MKAEQLKRVKEIVKKAETPDELIEEIKRLEN